MQKPTKPQPKPLSYTPCSGGLKFRHGYPYSAGAIKVHAVDCSTAEQFIRRAHETRCRNALTCKVEGYKCRSDYAGTQQESINCANGPIRIEWIWAGGY